VDVFFLNTVYNTDSDTKHRAATTNTRNSSVDEIGERNRLNHTIVV